MMALQPSLSKIMQKVYMWWGLRITLCALSAWWAIPAAAQVTGGKQVFRFMLLSPSGRITALGGAQVAVRDDDVAIAAANPGALNETMDGRLSLQHNLYLSDVQHGYAAYAYHWKKTGLTLHSAAQYMDYGKMPQADVLGNIMGEVTAKETAFTLGVGRSLSSRWSLGMNIRYALSVFDVYRSAAIASDVGLLYADTTRRVTAGLVVRNYGAQLAAYDQNHEPLAYDVQLGVSKRLKYLPLRLSAIAHHLHQWNIRYDDPALRTSNQIDFNGEEIDTQGSPLIDNFFRHLIFNAEFLLGRSEAFKMRLGYNHLRKRELSVRNLRSLAGFSGGIGLKFGRFRVDMGYASYHLAGSAVHFGVSTRFKDFF